MTNKTLPLVYREYKSKLNYTFHQVLDIMAISKKENELSNSSMKQLIVTIIEGRFDQLLDQQKV